MENTRLSLSERFKKNVALSWLAAAAIMLLAGLFGWQEQLSTGAGEIASANFIPAMEIFKNNISMMGVNLLGVLTLGIPNLISGVMNGYAMGSAFALALGQFGPVWFFTDILPHGIFEIPVIVASVSVGVLPWMMIANRIYHPEDNRKQLLVCILKYLAVLAAVCCAALLAAAFIESYVSMA